MRAAIPAAIGAARVPRRSFKTAYTNKKTKTMSATLRGSIIRLKYSVYGRRSNIFADRCSSVKSVRNEFSTNTFCDRLLFVSPCSSRGFEKYHLDLGLRTFDAFLDLLDRLHDITGDQTLSQLHVRIDQDLFRREVHSQQLNHIFNIGMTFDRLFDCCEHLRSCCFTQQQTARRTREHESDYSEHDADQYRRHAIPVSAGTAADLVIG